LQVAIHLAVWNNTGTKEINVLLVTGAAGRSGQHVIAELAVRHVRARALVRGSEQVAGLASFPTIDAVVGDMLVPHTLETALAGVDRVLMISSAGPLLLETQCTFVDAAKKAGVRHVIKFSGAESGDGFDSENFRSTRNHEQAQRYLEGSGIGWTHLRPSQFMEDYLPGAPTGVRAGLLALPLGDTELAPIALNDVAKIAVELLLTEGHEGRSYEMTGPESLSMDGIASLISDATGVSVKYLDVPPHVKLREWLDMGFPSPRAEAFGQLMAERRAHPRSSVKLDTHRLFAVEPTPFSGFAHRNADRFTHA
jgi:uncharacterized protein YbjT (DUF2867 family)